MIRYSIPHTPLLYATHTLHYTTLTPREQTGACENITFPNTLRMLLPQKYVKLHHEVIYTDTYSQLLFHYSSH